MCTLPLPEIEASAVNTVDASGKVDETLSTPSAATSAASDDVIAVVREVVNAGGIRGICSAMAKHLQHMSTQVSRNVCVVATTQQQCFMTRIITTALLLSPSLFPLFILVMYDINQRVCAAGILLCIVFGYLNCVHEICCFPALVASFVFGCE